METQTTVTLTLDGDNEPRTFSLYDAGVEAYKALSDTPKFEIDNADIPGPRQVSAFKKAANALLRSSTEVRDIEGVVGQTARFSNAILITGKRCWTAPREAYDCVHQEFGGVLSRANANALTKALASARAALDTSTIPVRDTRELPEEKAEREAKQAEASTRFAEQEEKRREELERSRILVDSWVPARIEAAIVAEYVQDESDPMTDYFSSRVERTVIIGWKTTKREDFRKLRQAAARFEPTADLAPGAERVTVSVSSLDMRNRWLSNIDPGTNNSRRTVPGGSKEIAEFSSREEAEAAVAKLIWDEEDRITYHVEELEHRDNYSMGRGNWVGRGHKNSTGWKVCSRSLGSLRTTAGLEIADHLTEPKPEPSDGKTPLGGHGFSIQEASNKRGPFALVVFDERMEREDFTRTRNSAKQAGGWYSRAWSGTPGGFGFDTPEAAQAWASSFTGGVA